MDKTVAQLVTEMIRHNSGDTRRIEHSAKVFSYAQTLGRLENLKPEQQYVLEITAILHDIGIRVAETKFGTSSAQLQETEGPPVARDILQKLQLPEPIIERVCYIISKHHTFSAIDDIVFQLIVEADFLVNSVEDMVTEVQVGNFAKKNFKTKSGSELLRTLFPNCC